MRSLRERFEAKFVPEPNSGCWIWTARLDRRGYGRFRHGDRNAGAHRVAYELYRSTVPGSAYVLHRCDNRACVNPDHLYLGTHADNMRDLGLRSIPKRNRVQINSYEPLNIEQRRPRSKLSARQVEEIRERYRAGGVLQRELAREYGISKAQTCNILAGRRQ